MQDEQIDFRLGAALEATVSLVDFDRGPGLRIDIVIPWRRLSALAQSIRFWQRKLESFGEVEGK